MVVWNSETIASFELKETRTNSSCSSSEYEWEVVKSQFEATRLSLIKHETGIILDNKLMKVLTRLGTNYLHSRSSGNNEVTTVIAAVIADEGKPLWTS